MLNRFLKLPKKSSFFLLGPRQTGKTTLINSQLDPRDFSYNLMHHDTYLTYKKEPSLFRLQIEKAMKSKQRPKRIFLDEIQKVPELLDEIQSLMDRFPCQFIMTGSSARKLRRASANLLGGRARVKHLHPLIFEELQQDFDLELVLQLGSLPATYNQKIKEQQAILKAYTQVYLQEEIQAEALTRNIGGFSRFLEIAANQSGEMVNYSAVGRDCGLATRTVQSYYEILEDTLIAFRLDPYRKSPRKRLMGHPKFYFFDTGVTNALNYRLQARLNPSIRGHLFEQWIILETYRYLDYLDSEIRLYYWRTNHGAEVDLILEKHGKVLAGIEIKSNRQIASSHLSGLRSFRDDHPKAQYLLVTPKGKPFNLNFAEVLPFEHYLSWLKKKA